MTTYNVQVNAPAITQALALLKAAGGTVVNIDANGVVHAQITGVDDWHAGQTADAITAALGQGTVVTRQ